MGVLSIKIIVFIFTYLVSQTIFAYTTNIGKFSSLLLNFQDFWTTIIYTSQTDLQNFISIANNLETKLSFALVHSEKVNY